jgi:hypothetical protein
MFQLQQIDPSHYRRKTRNATLIIMAIFIVIGYGCARATLSLLGEYSNSPMVLNFIGAFIGLIITSGIVKLFFSDKPWMQEAMYAWRLKRHLMMISNEMVRLKQALKEDDIEAMKIMRFYHLGTEQMHQLDNNSHALIELKVEKKHLETKLKKFEVEFNQNHFKPEQLTPFKNNS